MSSFAMEDVVVEKCDSGVKVIGNVVAKCTDLEVRNCVGSGVWAAWGASIILIGTTRVHDNCKDTKTSKTYGLQTSENSSICSVFPLIREVVSTNNGEHWQWGALNGDVRKIKSISLSAMQRIVAKSKGEVRVPEDCVTMKDAVAQVHNSSLTTVVLGNGEHEVGGDYLKIPSAMNIVGVGNAVVNGGIWFGKGRRDSHLKNLTLRGASHSGVYGQSPFTMEDVVVERCGRYGIFALSDVLCTNVEVRLCEWGGIAAMGHLSKIGNGNACIKLDNANVHNNCTANRSFDYGIYAYGSSTIELASAIQKVSHDNGGGGNYCKECVADKNGCTVTSMHVALGSVPRK